MRSGRGVLLLSLVALVARDAPGQTSCVDPPFPPGEVGVPYSEYRGIDPGTCCDYHYQYTTYCVGGLPPGLVCIGCSGYCYGIGLSGTPTQAGTFCFFLEGCYDPNCTPVCMHQAVCLLIRPSSCLPVVLDPPSLPRAEQARSYTVVLSAVGNTPPYTFAVTSGRLPQGLSLGTDGVLSGAPAEAGVATFTVTATSSDDCRGSQDYSLVVEPKWDFVFGRGPAAANDDLVVTYDSISNLLRTQLIAYGAGAWGVNVAGANVDGAIDDRIITGPGPGDVLGPHGRAFDRDGSAIPWISWFAYGTLRFGLEPGAGDLEDDGLDELLTAPGPGAVFGPHVRGWRTAGQKIAPMPSVSFYAFQTLRYGANLAGADLDGDGDQEIVAGPGPGETFAATVRGFEYTGAGVVPVAKVNFNAQASRFGVELAAGDVDGDAFDEIATAPGAGPFNVARFRTFQYDGAAVAAMAPFFEALLGTVYGGRVALGDVSGDGWADLILAAGPDPAADSSVVSYEYGAQGLSWDATIVPFTTHHGTSVGAVRLGYP